MGSTLTGQVVLLVTHPLSIAYVIQHVENTVVAVVRLALIFLKRLPKSLEATLKSSKEFGTYSKTIICGRIVFTLLVSLFRVFIIVLSSITFQINSFEGQVPNSFP